MCISLENKTGVYVTSTLINRYGVVEKAVASVEIAEIMPSEKKEGTSQENTEWVYKNDMRMFAQFIKGEYSFECTTERQTLSIQVHLTHAGSEQGSTV